MTFIIAAVILVLCFLFFWFAFRKKAPKTIKRKIHETDSMPDEDEDSTFLFEDEKLREEFTSAGGGDKDRRQRKPASKKELKNVPRSPKGPS